MTPLPSVLTFYFLLLTFSNVADPPMDGSITGSVDGGRADCRPASGALVSVSARTRRGVGLGSLLRNARSSGGAIAAAPVSLLHVGDRPRGCQLGAASLRTGEQRLAVALEHVRRGGHRRFPGRNGSISRARRVGAASGPHRLG